MYHDSSVSTSLAEITVLVEALQADAALLDPANFVARVGARQNLRVHQEHLDRMSGAANPDEQPTLSDLKRALLRFNDLLDQVDASLFAAYGVQVRAGTLSSATFATMLHRFALPTLPEIWQDPPTYDHLDNLLDGVLQIDAPPTPRSPLSPEMIPYQATPLRILLDMADRLALTSQDVFYDLGAGLGRVVLGMALMSAGIMKGVEIDLAYVEYAQHRAQDLNLTQVSFVHADAQVVDYADGTVFFLYTPFKGATLRRVLGLLRVQARTRRIRVCTYGPGTLEVQDQDWLTSDDDPARDVHYVTIFESKLPRRRTPITRRRRL